MYFVAYFIVKEEYGADSNGGVVGWPQALRLVNWRVANNGGLLLRNTYTKFRQFQFILSGHSIAILFISEQLLGTIQCCNIICII
jgi:hypothetical protein